MNQTPLERALEKAVERHARRAGEQAYSVTVAPVGQAFGTGAREVEIDFKPTVKYGSGDAGVECTYRARAKVRADPLAAALDEPTYEVVALELELVGETDYYYTGGSHGWD